MPFNPFSTEAILYVSPAGRWLVLAICFVLGGVLGSFLNVVAYRLPRRMSFSYPGSRCGTCGHPIRWYDNVPILGWLRLGGRCRDCHVPISARYPLVEAAVALCGALLGWRALVEIAPPVPDEGAAYAIHFGLFAFQMLLVCTLVAAALIEFDGGLPPLRMLVPVLVVGFVLAGIWPQLRANAATHDVNLGGAYDGASGLLAALVLSGLAWPGWVATAGRRYLAAGIVAAAELALVGVYLGAREAAIIAAVAMACYAAFRATGSRWPPARRIGWAGCLAAVTLLHIVAWPEVVVRMPILAEQGDLKLFAAAGFAVAIAAIVARLIAATPGRIAH